MKFGFRTSSYASDNGYWYLTPDGTWIYISEDEEETSELN